MSSDILSIQEEIFKLIGNQKRLEILLLLEHRELNVGEMTDMLGLRQANLSQHLTLLRAQHLVEVRKKGRESFYTLADDSIAAAIRSIHDFLRHSNRIALPPYWPYRRPYYRLIPSYGLRAGYCYQLLYTPIPVANPSFVEPQ